MRKKATCHPEKNVHSRGLCSNCYAKVLYHENPEKFRAAQKITNQRQIERLRKDPEKYAERNRARALKARYGINHETYGKMLDAQGGRCGICREETSYKLYVDHNHRTDEVRGLLCARCNTAVGFVETGPEFLVLVDDYIKKYEKGGDSPVKQPQDERPVIPEAPHHPCPCPSCQGYGPCRE